MILTLLAENGNGTGIVIGSSTASVLLGGIVTYLKMKGKNGKVSKELFDEHRNHCSKTFDSIHADIKEIKGDVKELLKR